MEFKVIDCLTGKTLRTETDSKIVYFNYASLLDQHFLSSDSSVKKIEASSDPVTGDRIATIYVSGNIKYRFVLTV